ncbi:hypothetical protein AB5J52_38785 [Streptomyces sp. R39]|uniref:TubC N-terminal docking domain-containing protein n=1 Tax=Streptomyces sp. R39 TaxID=3238631 RepID=A0AB39QYV5_9ACTN
MDMEIAPNNINNTRLKLKRLVERGIQVETEQGLFTQPRPQAARRRRYLPAHPGRSGESDIRCHTAL